MTMSTTANNNNATNNTIPDRTSTESNSPWSFDPAKNMWYRFCADSNAFVYQNGQKFYASPVPRVESDTATQNEENDDEALHSGSKFFRVGRVFYDVYLDPDDEMKETAQFFVVVRQKKDSSICVPITTYNGKGVSDHRNITKHHHAIIHTGDKRPHLSSSERPQPGELGMQKRIVVRSQDRNASLDPLARINYGKTYEMRHEQEVHYFGDVHPDYLGRLQDDWEEVQSEIVEERERARSGMSSGGTRSRRFTSPGGGTYTTFEGDGTRGFTYSNVRTVRTERSAAGLVAGLASLLIGGYTLYSAASQVAQNGPRRRR